MGDLRRDVHRPQCCYGADFSNAVANAKAMGEVRVKRLGIAALVLSLFGCDFNASGPAVTAPQIRPAAFVNDATAAPEVVSSHGVATLELAAVINSTTALPTFLYEGGYVAPTIRVNPGDTIVVDLDDELPPGKGAASEVNMHFHGLNVSPRRPADDTITMFAKSGRTLYYSVPIPATQPPGLYWYHTHIHGQTNIQVGQGGMSGAIVVEGIAAHVPALAKMPERILVVRELGNNGGEARHHDGAPKGGMDSMGSMEMPGTGPGPTTANVPCAPLAIGDYETVNSQLRPTIRFTPGKPVFFRLLNATGHRHMDLTLGGIPMHVVGIDGYPIDTYPGEPSSFAETHIVVPPAGRVEFYATLTAPTDLRTQCFDSGPIGDSDPAEVLAHLRPYGGASAGERRPRFKRCVPERRSRRARCPLRFRRRLHRASCDSARTRRVSTSTAGRTHPTKPPCSSYTSERSSAGRSRTSRWKTTTFTCIRSIFTSKRWTASRSRIRSGAIPWSFRTERAFRTDRLSRGSITLIADFRERNIRGTFLFHCHILDHEDGGMMAKIQAI